jgi:hypothetical protein
MDWYISNINNTETDNNIPFLSQSESISVFIDGFILPRTEFFETYKNKTQEDLVRELFEINGERFIDFIKGSFIIVIKDGNKIQLYTDRHASVKCFYYRTKDKFIVSNSLNEIKKYTDLKLSKENAALFTLFNHFIGDITLFHNIFQVKPAAIVNIIGQESIISKYWKPEYLFAKKKTSISVETLANEWSKLTRQYYQYLKPAKTALTLTGGNDSRMILAGLLTNGITPLNMTYGNPKSADVIVARKISKKLDLPFINYYIEKPTTNWFQSVVERDILPFSNTLVNIHRAHRIDAIKKLKLENPEVDMLYTGLVGGEYIKRPSYNNITIPEIYDSWIKLKDTKDKIDFIRCKLQSKGLKTDTLDLKYIISELNKITIPEDNFKPDEIKFIHLYNYYAVNHHTQDPTLFRSKIKYIVNPYMDIDFLESLSKSKDWYLNKKVIRPMEKVWHSYLQVKITHILYPAMSSIAFAKNGEYTGLEMLKTPLKYLMKRVWKRLRKSNVKYERNFPMGSWLYDFSKNQLNDMDSRISILYKENYIEQVLQKAKNKKSEENWHSITAPINLNINYTFFKKD